jgi:hypothetical protein
MNDLVYEKVLEQAVRFSFDFDFAFPIFTCLFWRYLFLYIQKKKHQEQHELFKMHVYKKI